MSNTENLELNKNIGNRIKAIRHIYNEGIRLTVEQFAHLLDINTEKLLNYESGRSALPISVLLELYNRGINPIFILTGNGEIFANNNVGRSLKKSILNKNINFDDTVNDILARTSEKENKLKLIASPIIKVSAGKIKI